MPRAYRGQEHRNAVYPEVHFISSPIFRCVDLRETNGAPGYTIPHHRHITLCTSKPPLPLHDSIGSGPVQNEGVHAAATALRMISASLART